MTQALEESRVLLAPEVYQAHRAPKASVESEDSEAQLVMSALKESEDYKG